MEQSLPQHANYSDQPPGGPVRWARWLGLAAVLAVAAVVAVCGLIGDGWTAVPLEDVSQPAAVELSGDGSWLIGHVTGLSVHITGHLDGEAEVWAGNWDPERLGGKVDWQVYHDWFLRDCTLHYRPRGKVSGRLVIRYQFH